MQANEKINYKIYETQIEAVKEIALEIVEAILQKQNLGKNIVIGLATGNSPILLYKEIIKIYQERKLTFKNVITFNLDEYYPIAQDAPQSYWTFMFQNFFSHVDIPLENIHIPDGSKSREEIKNYCDHYNQLIEDLGGIDLQLLGIGQNGHIGFNEPGSGFYSKTRIIHLEYNTMVANSGDFNGISNMPQFAITVGIRNILEAKKIILIAWGNNKSSVIAQAIEGPITELIPASILQTHKNCIFYLDKYAASQLNSIKRPWLDHSVKWDKKLTKSAVVDLCFKLKKTILSLTTQDYLENGLTELIFENNKEAYQINLEVFYQIRDTITGWPAGKMNAHFPNHPERKLPFPKKVLIFSPHPDDDIISMGGTLIRLHEQHNLVHVAYQVSGNIAVNNSFVLRYLDFIKDYEKQFLNLPQIENLYKKQIDFLQNKNIENYNTPEILKIKGIIRQGEAKATCNYVGLNPDNVHFLQLPFYETGKIQKNPYTQKDIDITINLLHKIKPHQVYCAGDLADPHGTHKVCLEIVIEALKQIKQAEPDGWIKDCWMWMYKGAWQEWNIDEIEMAVPMSPEQVLQKRLAIYNHQSQKDIVPFMGSDIREFWQRAENRNKETAEKYAALGLTQYAAIEAFVKYYF